MRGREVTGGRRSEEGLLICVWIGSFGSGGHTSPSYSSFLFSNESETFHPRFHLYILNTLQHIHNSINKPSQRI